MAVLQRTPHAVEHEGVLSLKRLYPFEKFDDQVRELDACLKVGGLLVVHLSQYRVADTAVAARYVALESRPYEADHTPKFDCTSRRTDAAAAVVIPSIFVKLADAGLGPTN